MMVAFAEEGTIFIGWSKCDISRDRFDKNLAYQIAIDRANKFMYQYFDAMEDTHEEFFDFDDSEYYEKVPPSVKKQMTSFAARSNRVFQESILTPYMQNIVSEYTDQKRMAEAMILAERANAELADAVQNYANKHIITEEFTNEMPNECEGCTGIKCNSHR
jgi:hypothetical protein